jgi:hypothetical protein
MTGTELETFATEIDSGASIGDTLLFQFINLTKAMVELRRPWMLLRYTDSSKTVTAGNTWQTAIDLSIIPRCFYESDDNAPIKLLDGNNRGTLSSTNALKIWNTILVGILNIGVQMCL